MPKAVKQWLCLSGCGQSFSTAGTLHRHHKVCITTQGNFEGKKAAARARHQAQAVARAAESATVTARVIDPLIAEFARMDMHDDLPMVDTDQLMHESPGLTPIDPAPAVAGAAPLPNRRRHFRPSHFKDFLPAGPGVLPPSVLHPQRNPSPMPQALPPAADPPDPLATILRVRRVHLREPVTTLPNAFGLHREYIEHPSSIPDENLSLDELVVIPVVAPPRSLTEVPSTAPFPNVSALQWANHHWNRGALKSVADREDLQDMLLGENFVLEEIRGVNFKDLDKKMDEIDSGTSTLLSTLGDGWKKSSVRIDVPLGKFAPTHSQSFVVPGLHHRPLLGLLREMFLQSPSRMWFHYTPYQTFRTFPAEQRRGKMRVMTELFDTEAWIADHEALPYVPGCDLPRCIGGLCVWSDATHLTQFGETKLWPAYAAPGNLPLWFKTKPSARALETFAYFPELPVEIHDFVSAHCGKADKAASRELITHCKRELMHAIWALLLDAEFLEAYRHGIIMDCWDNIRRRVFPRLMTYSADYPEKMLMLALRYFGKCPCPRCFVPKALLGNMATGVDLRIRRNIRVDNHSMQYDVRLARRWIYTDGVIVNNAGVQRMLQPKSWTPTINALADKLGPLGFQLYLIFPSDFMHEITEGDVEKVITHVIRILHSIGAHVVQEFDARFRAMPTFGCHNIRKFPKQVSAMRQFAAYNWECVLRCLIPCIEGLIPDKVAEAQILDTIWELTLWFSVAKLHIQTEDTVALLRANSVAYGQEARRFRDETCPKFRTIELEKEVQSRVKRGAAQQAKKAAAAQADGPPSTAFPSPQAADVQAAPDPVAPVAVGKKEVIFHLDTYKHHGMPDYPDAIESHGPTSGYSTEMGEFKHRGGKESYPRTSRQDFIIQLAHIDHRQRLLYQLSAENNVLLKQQTAHRDRLEVLPFMRPQEHHHIATGQSHWSFIGPWLQERIRDMAFRDFLPNLRNHIISRLRGRVWDGDEVSYSREEHNQLFFQNDQIFEHSAYRVNYSTYDIRRDQDSVNPKNSRCDLLVKAQDEGDPSRRYWYCRVIGIYHVNVKIMVPGAPHQIYEPMQFLFVRWYGEDPDSSYCSGWRARRHERVGFVTQPLEAHGPDHPDAPLTPPFGFLDPASPIRGVHMIPAFAHGRTEEYLAPSMVRDVQGDWKYHYVNRFVDEDYLMRFTGGGIGHHEIPEHVTTADFLAQFRAPPRGRHPAGAEPQVDLETEDELEREYNEIMNAAPVIDLTRGDEAEGDNSDLEKQGDGPPSEDEEAAERDYIREW